MRKVMQTLAIGLPLIVSAVLVSAASAQPDDQKKSQTKSEDCCPASKVRPEGVQNTGCCEKGCCPQ